MRKLPFLLLLATAAAPALAAPDDDGGRRHNRNSESDQSEARSQRSEARQERAASRQQQSQSEQRQLRAEGASSNPSASDRQGYFERVRQQAQEQRQQRAASTQSDADASTSSGWRPRERQVRTIPDTTPSSATTQRSGEVARAFEGRPRRDYRNGNYKRWTDNWRHDYRYDWRSYRDRHRSLFRLGFYYDPFGWSYRRWSIGSFLWPSYYGSSFWLNDPWHYRLPPAYGPYRWVRYWDDALLVNIYTGQVVDVIHNFFW